MKERLDYIDTAKGIGIIFVVFGHHLLEAESFRHWISCFHMPLFFIISGFLFAFRNNYSQTFGNYLIKKLQRLLYPFFVLSFIVLMWNVFFYHILFSSLASQNDISRIFLDTITTYGYHALWFLPCLFYSSVLFYLLRKHHLHHFIWIIIIAFILVFSITPKAEVMYNDIVIFLSGY